ncbi:family 10 glycosylhydrolase [Alkaliphilus serpentinus]|uniref:Family 10 glycosylhydrolase n=1 Tax=Alkaliphilus serpentinus TaxID=1482731 RepID=A0A833M8F9_9FIRM|nr:family 10 glycosylhydrolase [Alkaliphilus serpentinus]KAB3525614.1 family 10 glycosylhydrolase [Alkaliphilus serpentinus]
MFNKSIIIKILIALLIMMLIISAAHMNILAASQPWEKYAEYIPEETPIAKRHLRGAWISTTLNLDWPSTEVRNIENDTERIEKTKEELVAILDRAVEMNMNAVFLQVSPEGDALYPSNIANWSRYLTGTFGKDPGFDPLAFAIDEAHKRNLEFHAWFNPYRVSMYTNPAIKESLDIEKSVYKDQPEWIRTAKNRFIVDPGIPEARDWVVDRVMEVVNNYDIDGIHFDDYFYYEGYEGELKDDETFNKYSNGEFSNKDDWRRNNTYILVKELSEIIRFTKPWVKFGISPSGVWGNKKDGHPDGSNTEASFTHYNSSFADTKKWIEEELIDYISPQIYWTFANTKAPYGEVASWWSEVVKDKNVHLYIGQALYKVNDNTDEYFRGSKALEEFGRQLKFNIVNPEIQGSIMFRFRNFNDISKEDVVNRIKDDLWSTKALIPVMPWKKGIAPNNPTEGKMEEIPEGLKVLWVNQEDDTAYYAIYRFNKGEKLDISSDERGRNLIATVRKNKNGLQQFIDKDVKDATTVAYAITALDRLHNESKEVIISLNQSNYFLDVDNSYSWAIEAIDGAYEGGIVLGDGKGLFHPGHNTKRGDFILMMVRALDLKADFQENFIDVPKNSYYHDAIGIAKELGIVKGTGVDFNPNGNITREDMMVIMDRTLEAIEIKLEDAEEEVLEKYKDANLISEYATGAIGRLTKAGLVQGSGGRVNPQNHATRAEIVVILDRLLKRIEMNE